MAGVTLLSLGKRGGYLAGVFPRPMSSTTARRSGRVQALRGVAFQSDAKSDIGAWFIRPFEALDRRVAGLHHTAETAPLAMHAGLHVALDDGREYVVEQLILSPYTLLSSGLCWTPLAEFRQRDRGGWDVTVPATAFRGVDEPMMRETAARLNQIEGRPFWQEDCTAFIERALGERQLFADSPTLRMFGLRGRLGDPALPLLRSDVPLDERTCRLLRTNVLYALPGPGEGAETHAARMWGGRLLAGASALLLALTAALAARRLAR